MNTAPGATSVPAVISGSEERVFQILVEGAGRTMARAVIEPWRP